MRLPRLKSSTESMAYHCMSHIVEGLDYFSDEEKEHMVDLMWRVTDFCGLELCNYEIMGNHYHLLVIVPPRREVDNWELLRRYEALHGKGRRQARLIRECFEEGGARARYWREKLLGWMYDISEHQRRFKEYFSKWYNRRHRRRGALWDGRFKAPVVEEAQELLCKVGVYIELNAVRAGLVKDPADYRFCSYHAALCGDERCLRGLQLITGASSGMDALAQLRQLMGLEGSKARGPGKRLMDALVCRKLLKAEGGLPFAAQVYWRNRYLVDSAVLGSRAYVERLGREFGRRSESERMKGCGEGQHVLLKLRRWVYGFE